VLRSYIPAEEAAKEWMKDPEFEFVLAAAVIKAHDDAGLTQGTD
jgi:hypothetical protein